MTNLDTTYEAYRKHMMEERKFFTCCRKEEFKLIVEYLADLQLKGDRELIAEVLHAFQYALVSDTEVTE